jgi:hypothetical protein
MNYFLIGILLLVLSLLLCVIWFVCLMYKICCIRFMWKETITIQFSTTAKKTDCSNYEGISLLSTSYKILSIIFPSRSGPYLDRIIGDHQSEFWCNLSNTGQILCICQILRKEQSYTQTVHQLFMDFKELLYIIILIGVPIKLVTTIKLFK